MIDVPLEQAIVCRPGAGGVRVLARSAGFADDWAAAAERLCAGFGDRPAGTACPEAVFARPLGPGHVAVARVADRGADGLGFHFLVLARDAYASLAGGDPFGVAERFPPPWPGGGELPPLTWPAGDAPPRPVEEVEQVLRRADSPVLLGGAQALVDGGRLVFERALPDAALLEALGRLPLDRPRCPLWPAAFAVPEPDLVRDLWRLLPSATRCQLWPAGYAFGNALGFDVLVVPQAAGREYAGHLTEQQAGDYPEGRYELAVQTAAEAGDQAELDSLFARRTSAQTLRLALIVLAGVTVLALLMNWAVQPPAPRPGPARTTASRPDSRGTAPAGPSR